MKGLQFLNSFSDAQEAFEEACKEGEAFDKRLTKELEKEKDDFGMRRNFEEVGDLMRESIRKLNLS